MSARLGAISLTYLYSRTRFGVYSKPDPEVFLKAAAFLSPRLSPEAARLCLIPTDAGERLCYEFRGLYGGQVYLSYINAETGRQEDLLRVVEGETGLQAQ